MTQHDDPCEETVRTFDRFAARYADKYFGLTQYDVHYAGFAARLPTGSAVLDLACGPGNVSAFLARARPDLSILGLDLAPNMIAQARNRVPGVDFRVGDCRDLAGVDTRFQGAAFAFGLSYLDDEDARRCFIALNRVLDDGAALLLATITGEGGAVHETASGGERVFVVYRTKHEVESLLSAHGYVVEFAECVPSPPGAPSATTDLVLLATRRAAQGEMP